MNAGRLCSGRKAHSTRAEAANHCHPQSRGPDTRLWDHRGLVCGGLPGSPVSGDLIPNTRRGMQGPGQAVRLVGPAPSPYNQIPGHMVIHPLGAPHLFLSDSRDCHLYFLQEGGCGGRRRGWRESKGWAGVWEAGLALAPGRKGQCMRSGLPAAQSFGVSAVGAGRWETFLPPASLPIPQFP